MGQRQCRGRYEDLATGLDVAATRARDLLVLPRHAATLPDKSWARTVDLDLPSLPALDLDQIGDAKPRIADATENLQTRAIFVAEAERISKAERKITWQRPSRGETEKTDAPHRPVACRRSGSRYLRHCPGDPRGPAIVGAPSDAAPDA